MFTSPLNLLSAPSPVPSSPSVRAASRGSCRDQFPAMFRGAVTDLLQRSVFFFLGPQIFNSIQKRKCNTMAFEH